MRFSLISKDAAEKIGEFGTNARVNPTTVRDGDDPEVRKSDVEFDVAITVTEQKDTAKTDKVGAAAGILSVVSMKVAGEAGNEKRELQRNESVSRVRFVVHLAQPSDINDRTEETRRKRDEDNAKISNAMNRLGNQWAS